MIKPLLRTLPSLSGNVQLACTTIDVRPVNEDGSLWESDVRGARLLPLSSSLWQKKIDASLISSTWEYDIPKFYAAYSDVFYDSCFSFDKADMLHIDKNNEQDVRSTDFEYGVKRVSYSQNGSQLSFYAPLYIDDAGSIPSYFLINITLRNSSKDGKTLYAVRKALRVNIGINKDSKKNYIYGYLQRYASRIDDNVSFCTPLTDQATYYGIDLQHGGFVTAIDNMFEKAYHHQTTIHNFDAIIAGAFERNFIVMKQIIPLSFQFNVSDILTEAEQKRFRHCDMHFDGAYYDSDGKKLPLYDFMHDYMNYREETLNMNPLTGVLQWSSGKSSNIMDTGFPSLNECRYINYEYANKLSPWFCRWKLKYSDDEHPYIMNNSWAFSKNQNSNYRYGQFPSVFHTVPSLASHIKPDGRHAYSLMMPVGDSRDLNSGRCLYMYAPNIPKLKYDDVGRPVTGPYEYVIDRYKRIMENYCSNWFETVTDYDSIYDDVTLWKEVKDGCVYYNGILYDLRNLYDLTKTTETIDRFAVLLHPNPVVFTEDDISGLRFAKSTLYRQDISILGATNVTLNDSMVIDSYKNIHPSNIYEDDDFSIVNKVYQDEVRFGEIFKEAQDGNFIDASNTAYAIDIDGHTTYGRLSLDGNIQNRYYDINDLYNIAGVTGQAFADVYNSTEYNDSETRKMISSYVMPNYGHYPPAAVMSSDVYAISSYVLTDTTRISNITYDDSVPKDVDIDFWKTTHNSTIIDIPSSYSAMTYNGKTLYERMKECSYVRHSDDAYEVMTQSYIDGRYNNIPYSYLHIGSATGATNDYGIQHYFRTRLINAAYIPYIENSFDAYTYLKNAYPKEWADIEDMTLRHEWQKHHDDHPAAYWAGRLTSFKNDVASKAYRMLYDSAVQKSAPYNIQDYEFVPMLGDSNEPYARNIFRQRSCWTNHFYGDAIPQSKLDYDNDVLWADPYNFSAIFANEGKEMPENAVYKDMYVKFLNKTHLFYWYVELFKDKDRRWNNEDNDFSSFMQEEWYKNLYIAEKKWIYDPAINGRPQMKMIYTPVEKVLQFPEYYRPYTHFNFVPNAVDPTVKVSSGNNAGDKYRSFIEFYNHIHYDPVEDFFTLPGFFDTALSPFDSLKITEETGKKWLTTEDNDKVITQDQMELLIGAGEYGYRYEQLSYSYLGDDGQTMLNSYMPIKFELVYRKPMYRVDKPLWETSHMSVNSDSNYRDIYFYRLRTDAETDAKYCDKKKICFQSGLSYIVNDLQRITSYTYITAIEKPSPYDHSTSYISYQYGNGNFERPLRLSDSGWSYIQQSDSMLVPLFDDIFMQTASDALIHTHYSLHDITTTDVVSNSPDENGIFDVIMTNYRFDKPDKNMMIEVSESERQMYRFRPAYKRYNECYSYVGLKSDDLGYGDYGMSTKKHNGLNYGFYYIESKMNNTADTFNMTGLSDDGTIRKLKYINYINGINITEKPEYIAAVYKQLMPLMKQQPLNVLSNINTVIYPKSYSSDLVYSQQVHDSGNDSKETDIIRNDRVLRTMSLLRYYHAMTPWIVPVTEIDSLWRLKLKDVNATMLDSGKYISTGDAPIYNVKAHISTFVPYNVYSPSDDIQKKGYNNITSQYVPLEYKYYNDSAAVLLHPHFEIKVPGRLTIDKVRVKEADMPVFDMFRNYLNGRGGRKFNDDETLFLLNKYKVSYNSVPDGLNIQQTEKLYTLSIIFDLQ